jgi:hypothetical protein
LPMALSHEIISLIHKTCELATFFHPFQIINLI